MIAHYAVSMQSGASASSEISVNDEMVCGIFFPAAVDGTLSIEVKNPLTGAFVAFQPITFVSSGYSALVPNDFLGVQVFRIKASTNQSSARQFIAAARV